MAGTASAPVAARDSVLLDAAERTFTVLGGRDGPVGRSLVLVFHGSKQDGESHRRFTGDALTPLTARGTVVAYLDGFRGNWNDARRQSSFPARLRNVDDVGFARAVIDRLVATHGIDRDRVVLVGYSNGGQMVFRLLHEAPEIGAAAVVVAALMPAPGDFLAPRPAPPVRPVPITLVHGTADRIVPFEGGAMKPWARALFKVGGRTLSARGSAAYFADRNGAAGEPETGLLPSRGSRNGTSVTRVRHHRDGSPDVQLYEIVGGGHTVPGPHPAPRLVGRTGHDIALIDLIADLLEEPSGPHPRTGGGSGSPPTA